MTDNTPAKPELLLSHSQIGVFLTCPAMYRHQYIRRISPRKRAFYFTVGSAMHKFIETWYSTRGNEELATRHATQVFEEDFEPELFSAEETHQFECDKAMTLGMCEGYVRYYTQDFDQYQSFLCEGRSKISLVSTHPHYQINYQAVLDALAQDAAGDWWIIETKTAGRVTSSYLQRVRIDSQVSGQMWVAKQVLGHFPKGVVYNVIKKPSIRLKKGETKQAYQKRVAREYSDVKNCDVKGYFTREDIIISKAQLRDWMDETQYIGRQIATMRAEHHPWWPKNTGACEKFGSACVYMPACIDRTYNRMLYEKRKRQ